MQFTRNEIKKLVNGLFQNSSDTSIPKHLEKENTLHPVADFLNQVIAKNFLATTQPESTAEKISASNPIPYSPLKSSLNICKQNRPELLDEFLHLCKSYQFKVHPIAASQLYSKASKPHKKAVLIAHFCKNTLNTLENNKALHSGILEKKSADFISPQDLLIQMFLYFEDPEYRKNILNKIECLKQGVDQINFIDQLTPKQKMLLSTASGDLPYTASKKWNTKLIKLSLALTNSEARLVAIREILQFFKRKSDSNYLSNYSRLQMEKCGMDTDDEWIFFLLSHTLIDASVEDIILKELGNYPVFTHRSILYNSLKFNNIKLFNSSFSLMQTTELFQSLESMHNAVDEIELRWDFIKNSVTLLKADSEFDKWKAYRLLISYFRGFLPDTFSLELLPYFRDSESRLMLTEEGRNIMAFLAEKLSLQANPNHLTKIENYKQNSLYHPLEKHLDKLIQTWRFRLGMRKDFERETKGNQHS